jgi:septal ring factor EnvC (AmiA/AmiB activator)
LQHANGYHSFLSGFGRVDAEMGQELSAGEPLGVLPVKAGTKPELYFEWRRGDTPIDPMSGLQKKS